MALHLRSKHDLLNAAFLLVLLVSLLVQPDSAFALGGEDGPNSLPSFSSFSLSVQDGRADHVRGVYVPNRFALPVAQQPFGSPGFVSSEKNLVTQFRMANKYGNVGLLAHNYLSGRMFTDLDVGDEVRLVHGDGTVEYFVVSEILRYQALQPHNVHSSFRNLEDDQILSVEKMFKRVYLGERHVTFQTCIEKDGELSWGRLFILAIPKAEYEALDPLYDL
jgi:hypothetical protein